MDEDDGKRIEMNVCCCNGVLVRDVELQEWGCNRNNGWFLLMMKNGCDSGLVVCSLCRLEWCCDAAG